MYVHGDAFSHKVSPSLIVPHIDFFFPFNVVVSVLGVVLELGVDIHGDVAKDHKGCIVISWIFKWSINNAMRGDSQCLMLESTIFFFFNFLRD